MAEQNKPGTGNDPDKTDKSDDSKKTDNDKDKKSFDQDSIQHGINIATAKHKKEIESIQKELNELRKLRDDIELEKADAEQKDLEKKQEYQKIIEKQKKSFEEDQIKLTGKIGTLEDDIRCLVIDSEIIKIIPDLKVVPGATSQIVQLVRPHFQFEKIDNNGEIEYKVFPSKNGNVMINDEGKEMTVQEFLKDFVEKNPHFLEPLAQGGSGAKSTRTQTGQTITTSRDAISLGLKKLRNQGA